MPRTQEANLDLQLGCNTSDTEVNSIFPAIVKCSRWGHTICTVYQCSNPDALLDPLDISPPFCILKDLGVCYHLGSAHLSLNLAELSGEGKKYFKELLTIHSYESNMRKVTGPTRLERPLCKTSRTCDGYGGSPHRPLGPQLLTSGHCTHERVGK